MYIHTLIIYMLKSIFKFLIFGFIFSFSSLNLFAQTFELIIHTTNSENFKIIKEIGYTKFHKTQKEAFQEINSISEKLSSKGYLNNKYTISENNTITTALFDIQEKIEVIRIYYPNNTTEKEYISQLANSSSNNYFEIPLHEVENTLKKIVAYYENKGYSFTNIYLTNISQNNSKLTADLIIDSSHKRTIDNAVFKGYPDFPKKYIEHYLNIEFGKPFNLESLKKLNKAINKLPFVSQIKKPEVLFTKDSTTLYIYVKKRQTSYFDGIIGFSNEENTGKIKFNGYLDLNLNNILNKGESFNINWENSQQKNSSLKLAFSTPYIFNSRINLKGSFNIFRQDSSFVNTKGIAELDYNINQQHLLGVIGTSENSNLPSNTNNFKNLSNFSKNSIGLYYSFIILENEAYTNQHKFRLDAAYFNGNRTSNTNKEHQNNIHFFAEFMVHLNTRNSIFIKNSAKLLYSKNTYENELYRIGGINSIRGFNENSIFTSRYSITNLEYQYRVNYNSYLYTITDFALLNDLNTQKTTQLYGVGLGYFLKTDEIILNLSYALGKNYKSPFFLNNSKVHIKLTYPF